MNFLDTLICQVDDALRSSFAQTPSQRPSPASAAARRSAPEDVSHMPSAALSSAEREVSVRLMRVNHVGEVCAQALYQGQILAAQDGSTKALLRRAANEERDHLAWCGARVRELGGQTSVLTPAFYAGAWALGVASGLVGDKWSMGFLVETERQVEAHLDSHLARLPAADHASRAVVTQMRADEIEHGDAGEAHGAAPLPSPIKAAMRVSSKVMTSTTYWI
jgi:3-demethoxyubiquinol 3-hydroxylase